MIRPKCIEKDYRSRIEIMSPKALFDCFNDNFLETTIEFDNTRKMIFQNNLLYYQQEWLRQNIKTIGDLINFCKNDIDEAMEFIKKEKPESISDIQIHRLPCFDALYDDGIHDKDENISSIWSNGNMAIKFMIRIPFVSNKRNCFSQQYIEIKADKGIICNKYSIYLFDETYYRNGLEIMVNRVLDSYI